MEDKPAAAAVPPAAAVPQGQGHVPTLMDRMSSQTSSGPPSNLEGGLLEVCCLTPSTRHGIAVKSVEARDLQQSDVSGSMGIPVSLVWKECAGKQQDNC